MVNENPKMYNAEDKFSTLKTEDFTKSNNRPFCENMHSAQKRTPWGRKTRFSNCKRRKTLDVDTLMKKFESNQTVSKLSKGGLLVSSILQTLSKFIQPQSPRTHTGANH